MPTSLDTYAPFDAGSGANVTEATWRKMMRHMLGSAAGVIRGFTNEFAVTGDGSGMNVKVATGECWIRGHYGESTAIKTLTIAASHATLARMDRVVLRADFTNNRVELDVLTGTAAATPVTPAVTQSTTVWETSLAVVSVAAAATSITATAGVVADDRVYTSAHARWEQTTAQSIPATTATKIVWDTLTYRTGDVSYDATNKRFTLLRPGLWHIVTNIRWAPNIAAGARQITISRDGEEGSNRQGMDLIGLLANQSQLSQCATALHRYTAGEMVSVNAYQETAGALLLATAGHETNISFAWVGP